MSNPERTLDLIEAFSERRSPLLLTEISALLQAPKSTCYGLLKTLQARGYIYSLGKRRGFYPTRRLYLHAEIIARNDPTASILDDAMTVLRDMTGETVIAGKRHGDGVVYLAVVEGVHTIRYITAPGDIKPLHSSAIGKAILSAQHLPIEQLKLDKFTENTICDPKALQAELDTGRERGFFVTCGENVAEVMAVAILLNVGGDDVAIAVAGPIARMKEHQDAIVAALMNKKSALESE